MFTCDVTKARSFARNFVSRDYRLFSHGDVSYRFNGKNDNVVLEYWLMYSVTALLLHLSLVQAEIYQSSSELEQHHKVR